MISLIRRMLETWPAKLFFLLLAGVFVIWGVGDVIRNVGTDSSVASVAGQKIELAAATDAYQRELRRETQAAGGNAEPTPAMRRQAVAVSLNALLTRTAVIAALTRDGVVVPDAALREATFAMPAFRGQDGRFDKAIFLSVLRNNGYTEQHFLDLLRDDLAQRQFFGAVRAGVASPDALTREVYAFQHEKRVAEAMLFRFADAPAPPEPTAAQLTRWYENHKVDYETPALRRIAAIVLSPETVAGEIQVSEDEIKAAYEARRNDFRQPERRSLQVVLMQDEKQAVALADAWRAGLDWAAVEARAKSEGGSPVELKDATKDEIPAPELAKAAFGAAKDVVLPPVHSALGWHVVKVVAISPAGDKSLAEVRDQIRAQVMANKAADLIDSRANKIDDMLSAGTKLTDLPGGLGVKAVTGTLDAEGMTPDGKPAPIPGDAALRKALIEAAFKARPGDAPQLIAAPHAQDAAPAYFAVSVETVTPPTPKPEAQVEDQVKADWIADQRRHAQNEAATRAMLALKSGQAAETVATIGGVKAETLPAVGRASPAAGVPAQLIGPLFSLKPGEATMVETPDGFLVARLSKIEAADPKADPVGFGQVREALGRSIGDDLELAVTQALRARGKPRINQAVADQIAQVNQ